MKKTKAPFINKRNEELFRLRGNYGKLPFEKHHSHITNLTLAKSHSAHGSHKPRADDHNKH